METCTQSWTHRACAIGAIAPAISTFMRVKTTPTDRSAPAQSAQDANELRKCSCTAGQSRLCLQQSLADSKTHHMLLVYCILYNTAIWNLYLHIIQLIDPCALHFHSMTSRRNMTSQEQISRHVESLKSQTSQKTQTCFLFVFELWGNEHVASYWCFVQINISLESQARQFCQHRPVFHPLFSLSFS